MEKWRGKVAVVTGASSGIGEAIAVKLVEAGMKVAGFARRLEKVESLSKSLQGKPGRLYAVKCDVTQEDDVLKGFKWVAEHLGPVQVLINNAGVARPTTLIDGKTEEWMKVIATNLTGLCICTREAIKAMRGNGQVPELPGHIIHINSIVGHKGLVANKIKQRVERNILRKIGCIKVSALIPQSNVYPATKHGVTALAQVLRNELNELKSRIKITSVSPGLVRTEIAEANGFIFNDEVVQLMKEAPILDSEDVADAVLYALGTKPHVLISELTIKPLGEKI